MLSLADLLLINKHGGAVSVLPKGPSGLSPVAVQGGGASGAASLVTATQLLPHRLTQRHLPAHPALPSAQGGSTSTPLHSGPKGSLTAESTETGAPGVACAGAQGQLHSYLLWGVSEGWVGGEGDCGCHAGPVRGSGASAAVNPQG